MSEFKREDNSNENVNPISFFSMAEQEPVQFVEKRDKNYVLFGRDNLFPEEIKNLSLQSTYHSSILKTKSDMLGGQGFVNELNDAKIDEFIENKNADLDMETVLHKIAQDLVTFNAFALYIQWTKDGNRIASIDYVDVSEVRVSKDRDNNGLRSFFHSPDWSRPKREENKPTEYEEFSPEGKSKEQILYIKEPSIFNTKFYTLPEYYPAWNYINLENKVSQFKNNYISNGMWAGAHVNIKANPTPEQKDDIVKEIKKQSQSEHNAGRMLVTFSEDESKQTTFEPIEMQFPDDFFEQTHSEIQQAILAQHHITNPKMLGLRIPGELGSSQGELERDIQQFYNLVIKPKERILERSLNMLFENSFRTLEDQKIELEKYNDFKNLDKSKNEGTDEQEEGGEEVDNENKPE